MTNIEKNEHLSDVRISSKNIDWISALENIQKLLSNFNLLGSWDPFAIATFEATYENLYTKLFLLENIFNSNESNENIKKDISVVVYDNNWNIKYSNNVFLKISWIQDYSQLIQIDKENKLNQNIYETEDCEKMDLLEKNWRNIEWIFKLKNWEQIKWNTILDKNLSIRIWTLNTSINKEGDEDANKNLSKFWLLNNFNIYFLGLLKLMYNDELISKYHDHPEIKKYEYISSIIWWENDILDYIKNRWWELLKDFIDRKIAIKNDFKKRLNPNWKGAEIMMKIDSLENRVSCYFTDSNYLHALNELISYLEVNDEWNIYKKMLNQIEEKESIVLKEILKKEKEDLLIIFLKIIINSKFQKKDELSINNFTNTDINKLKSLDTASATGDIISDSIIEILQNRVIDKDMATKIYNFIASKWYSKNVLDKVVEILKSRIIWNTSLINEFKKEDYIEILKKIKQIEELCVIGDLIVDKWPYIIFLEKGWFYNNNLLKITSYTNQEVNDMLNNWSLWVKIFGKDYEKIDSKEEHINENIFWDEEKKSKEPKNELDINTKNWWIWKVFLKPYTLKFQWKVNKILIWNLISEIEEDIKIIDPTETWRFFQKEFAKSWIWWWISDISTEDIMWFMDDIK